MRETLKADVLALFIGLRNKSCSTDCAGDDKERKAAWRGRTIRVASVSIGEGEIQGGCRRG